jgi:hypothetical protein
MCESTNNIRSQFSLVKNFHQSDSSIHNIIFVAIRVFSLVYFLIEMDAILILAITLLIIFIGALVFAKNRQTG